MKAKKLSLCIVVLLICSMLSGCLESLGPNRMSIGYDHQRYKADSDAYRGISIGFEWDLK